MSEMDNDFEKRLEQQMRQFDPPAGFTDSVMAKVQTPRKANVLVMQPRVRTWISGAIAAALALSVFVGEQIHQRHERELATQQFETATRITDQALEHTRQQLAKAGVPLD